MRIIGIDPGITGAIAVLDDGKFSYVIDIPAIEKGGKTVVKRHVDVDVLAATLDRLNDLHLNSTPPTVFLEKVQAMTKQGVASVFSLGDTLGSIRGCVAGVYGKSPIFVRPQEWKKHYGLTSDKEQCRQMAIDLFPKAAEFLKRKKDHNKAEALLIALYAHNTYEG